MIAPVMILQHSQSSPSNRSSRKTYEEKKLGAAIQLKAEQRAHAFSAPYYHFFKPQDPRHFHSFSIVPCRN